MSAENDIMKPCGARFRMGSRCTCTNREPEFALAVRTALNDARKILMLVRAANSSATTYCTAQRNGTPPEGDCQGLTPEQWRRQAAIGAELTADAAKTALNSLAVTMAMATTAEGGQRKGSARLERAFAECALVLAQSEVAKSMLESKTEPAKNRSNQTAQAHLAKGESNAGEMVNAVRELYRETLRED